MESFSALTPAPAPTPASSDMTPATAPTSASSDGVSMIPQPERPKQGKFSDDETSFLKTHLPAYEVLCQQLEQQEMGSVKGRKKDWIISKVYVEFVEQFSSDQKDGPQLQSLQQKIVRWFTNRTPHRKPDSVFPTVTPKRPRTINGPTIFAEEHKTRIKERMAEEQDLEGGIPKDVNLRRYHSIKQDLYSQLTDDERHAYEEKAAKKNEAGKALPEPSEIFENQENLVGGVVRALHDLTGWDWGKYGEVVFFVQGAYRNSDDNLKMFNASVSSNVKVTSFSSTLPNYKDGFRATFREWADDALPVHLSPLENPVYVEDVRGMTADADLENNTPLLQPSPPLSESVVKSAIQNVADAGYLCIISDENPADEITVDESNQGGGNVTAGNSNSKKRRREETEQCGPVGDKKHRSKAAVPPREQSSRLKDASYKNKHVTVRPR